MEKFKVRSDSLRGKNAKNTMESIAYTIAKHHEISVVEDVMSAISLGLDGGPEIWCEDIAKIVDDIKNKKIVVNRANLALNIRELINTTDGWFSYGIIDREFAINNPQEKAYRRKVLFNLANEGIIEKHPERSGVYRRIIQEVEKIDWKNVKTDETFDIKWPFHLEKWVSIYPKNIIVVAGSPNAGKTALLLNTTELNMNRHQIHYFSSEMAEQEFHLRMSKFDRDIHSWNFESYTRSSDFARVIQPNDINIIDFLEIGDNFFIIADEFRKIFDSLKNGIAIVALQKKTGASMGRGAEFGMEKPRLYLTMDSGELTIQKAKNWATKTNPNGIKFQFKLVDGCKFIYKDMLDEIPF